MIYESLTLRPSSGALDHDGITAWLASRDYAFLDPREGRVWLLCASKDDVKASRREWLDPTRRFCHDVMVMLFPDSISVNAHVAGRSEHRALELLRWLAREGEWTVQRDQSPPEPLGDPTRLFPDDVDVPNLTISADVTEGVLREWAAADRTFAVHSSGQFSAAIPTQAWRGFLSATALSAWNAAVAPRFLEDGMLEYAHPETATGRFDIETATTIETAWFDADRIPDGLRPLAALVERWLDELARSAPSSTIFRRLLTGRTTGAPAPSAGEYLIDGDFTGANLEDADLSHVVAGGARFDDARLARCSFVKAELTGTSFKRASAIDARFVKATLRDAVLEDAALRRAQFDQASLTGARLVGAGLQDTSWWKATLRGADLSRTDLRGARFADTLLDAATRFDGALGIAEMRIESILVGGRRLEGDAARAWVETEAARPAWTVEDLQLWMLAKMRSPRVEPTVRMKRTADELGAVFDNPGHAAAEYRRILGAPRATHLTTVTGTFAGSFRHEYALPLWPDVVFIVNEHPDGYAWGFGFEGGASEIASVEPWRCTAERLRREATGIEILDEWSFDLDCILTFATGARFRARFDLGLLQTWEPADP